MFICFPSFEGEALDFEGLFLALENPLDVFGVFYDRERRKAGGRQHHKGVKRDEEGAVLSRKGRGRYGVVGWEYVNMKYITKG